MSTQDDDRAIAEALGWRRRKIDAAWIREDEDRGPDNMPTLETDRALCMDAVEWLARRRTLCMDVEDEGVALEFWPHSVMEDTMPAALRAAMLKELGR